MTAPIDIATRETTGFIDSHLGAAATIVEVGCGDGHVAAALTKLGHQVIGVESDGQAAGRAQRRGIDVVHATWPEFDCAPVDAVVFTRSLHHINPLERSVARARELLKPAGILLIEDFAFDAADDATITWFLELVCARRELLTSVAGEFVTTLLEAREPVSAWRRDHDHELHTFGALKRAVAEHFDTGETQPVPYLYRYLVPVMPETAEAAALVEGVLREEAQRGERGEIVLIGRRIIGRRLPSYRLT